MADDSFKLISIKSDCCGCGGCRDICSRKAITMNFDEYGCVYPSIDYNLCVSCGACKKNCAYQNNASLCNEPQETFVAVLKDKRSLKKSASGGVFWGLAKELILQGGVVYGCVLEQKSGEFVLEHKRVTSIKELIPLQGSKYAQSNTVDVYRKVQADLMSGKKVLFSGTPCQIDALKTRLKNTDNQNLYTIDIICHGTPGNQFFINYLKFIESRYHINIKNYWFRDKTKGWGLNAKIDFEDLLGKMHSYSFPSYISSYYSYFLKGETYRESCYSCQYAKLERFSDITIGDFWGIEKEHPDYLTSNKGLIDVKEGVSCVLVNTPQGKKLLDSCGSELILLPSSSSKVARWNRQLNKASTCSKNRENILRTYSVSGFAGINTMFVKEIGLKYYAQFLKNLLKNK